MLYYWEFRIDRANLYVCRKKIYCGSQAVVRLVQQWLSNNRESKNPGAVQSQLVLSVHQNPKVDCDADVGTDFVNMLKVKNEWESQISFKEYSRNGVI